MLRLALSIPASTATAAALALCFPAWAQKRKRLLLAAAAAYSLLAALTLAKNAVKGGLALPLKAGLPWLDGWLLRCGPLFHIDGLALSALAAICALNFAGALHNYSRQNREGALSPQAAGLSMALLCLALLSASLPWTFALLCCADACAFSGSRKNPGAFAALLLPCLPAGLAVFAVAGASGTFSAHMLDVQRDAALLPRAALELPAWLLGAAAAMRLFAPPFTTLAPALAKTDFASSQLTLCAAPLAWFATLARLDPVLAPAMDNGLAFWAALAAFCALALRAILARDAKQAAGGAAAAASTGALLLCALGNYQSGALFLFSTLPACALALACSDSVDKTFGTSLFEKLGRARFAMPITHLAAMLAALSIAGLPPFSGFYALKAALGALSSSQQPLALTLFCGAALISGAAAVRSFHLIFNGEHAPDAHDSAAEAPLPELSALIFLSCMTLFSGWLFSRAAVLPLMLALPHAQGHETLLWGLAAAGLAAAAVMIEIFYQTRWRWQRKPSRRRPAEAIAWLLELRPAALAATALLSGGVWLSGALERLTSGEKNGERRA